MKSWVFWDFGYFCLGHIELEYFGTLSNLGLGILRLSILDLGILSCHRLGYSWFSFLELVLYYGGYFFSSSKLNTFEYAAIAPILFQTAFDQMDKVMFCGVIDYWKFHEINAIHQLSFNQPRLAKTTFSMWTANGGRLNHS